MAAVQGKYLASRLRPAVLAKGPKGGSAVLSPVSLTADQAGKDVSIPNALEGTPYPLVSGKDLYGNDIIVPITIKGHEDEMYFPEAVVNISRDRTIVATPVLNGRGTVKEMITAGDLKVSISLAVVSTSQDGDYDGTGTRIYDTYPYKGVERLRKLLDTPDRIDIVSDFLKLFDLDGGDFGIVVESYSVNQTTHQNRQVFDIQAVSDYDYNLIVES